MNIMRSLIIVVSLSAVFVSYSFGQGCSDAGFCTINGLKPANNDSIKIKSNHIKLGGFYGKADHSILIYGNYLEYYRQLNSKIGINLKLTSIAQNGNGISVYGLSDLFLNSNYNINEMMKFIIGVKIPFSSGNKSRNNLSLPMHYQSSLGTVDIIAGFGYIIRDWQFVFAIQQPVTQNNNEFLASNYTSDSELSSFQSTNEFKRNGDMLLRVSYPINITPKLKLTPSVLPIYHLKNDSYTDEMNIEREIEGSQGLTLNGNVYVDFEINKRDVLQLNVGMPFIVRDARPDGLTRSFIANIEYRISF